MRAVIPTDGVYMVHQEARSHTRAVIPTDGVYMVHQEARSHTRAVIPTDDILNFKLWPRLVSAFFVGELYGKGFNKRV